MYSFLTEKTNTEYNIFYWPGTRAAFNDVGKVIVYYISSLGYNIGVSDNVDRSKINIIFGS